MNSSSASYQSTFLLSTKLMLRSKINSTQSQAEQLTILHGEQPHIVPFVLVSVKLRFRFSRATYLVHLFTFTTHADKRQHQYHLTTGMHCSMFHYITDVLD